MLGLLTLCKGGQKPSYYRQRVARQRTGETYFFPPDSHYESFFEFLFRHPSADELSTHQYLQVAIEYILESKSLRSPPPSPYGFCSQSPFARSCNSSQ